jgi:thiamine biosynthesis lipoprotein
LPVRAVSIAEIHYVMGTYLVVAIDGAPEIEARPAMRRCFVEARRLERIFSRYDRDSELNRLNAGTDPAAPLSTDMAELLGRARVLGESTGGAFDVTIGALTLPAAVAASPMRPPRMQLDFDGIAKGYAVDRCAALLRNAGITRALINFGESSQYALGAPIGEHAWLIGVRGLAADAVIGTVALRDQALSASAVFGRFREIGGRAAGHITDPQHGQPLQRDALAVAVASNATDAEAYSKALLIWNERSGGRGACVPKSAQAALVGAVCLDGERIDAWRAAAIGFRSHRIHLTAAAEPLR